MSKRIEQETNPCSYIKQEIVHNHGPDVGTAKEPNEWDDIQNTINELEIKREITDTKPNSFH